MAFRNMIDRLIAEGLLDKNKKLTQRGHEYVQKVKKDFDAKTIENMEKANVARSTRTGNVPWTDNETL